MQKMLEPAPVEFKSHLVYETLADILRGDKVTLQNVSYCIFI